MADILTEEEMNEIMEYDEEFVKFEDIDLDDIGYLLEMELDDVLNGLICEDIIVTNTYKKKTLTSNEIYYFQLENDEIKYELECAFNNKFFERMTSLYYNDDVNIHDSDIIKNEIISDLKNNLKKKYNIVNIKKLNKKSIDGYEIKIYKKNKMVYKILNIETKLPYETDDENNTIKANIELDVDIEKVGDLLARLSDIKSEFDIPELYLTIKI